ncbi:MAG TPA: hypothetical protein VJA82_10625 [Sediminibacterium sp.]|uniref:hypothetical protein n=1 Tax=Sediminibacterium sp. TaxID=1917865 RepID=UPI002B4B8D56|nr:hypothetical protein [Sediminibacterium sp.]HLD53751.1 hypothetical protein [Sediminibacterium sp.]
MGGVFMVVFSFIYPLEKKQKIELEINLYNKQITLLNEEVKSLNKEVENLKIKSKETIKTLENIKSNKDSATASREIREIQETYNKVFYATKAKENEIITKDIILKYEKSKIALLENHINSFSIFRWLFLIIGTTFTIFGLWNWNKSTLIYTEMQRLELEKKRGLR